MASAAVMPRTVAHHTVEHHVEPGHNLEARPTRSHDASPTAGSKRPRAEPSCDGCQRKRAKCVKDYSNAPCGLCRVNKEDCTFRQGPVPLKQRMTTQPRVSPQPHQTAYVEERRVAWRDRSTERAPLERAEHTLSLERYRHCRHVGPSSVLDPSLLGLVNFDRDQEAPKDRGSIRRVRPDVFFDILSDSAVGNQEDELQALYQLEQIVSPHGPALIELYFERVHPSFPVIHKRSFVDRHLRADAQASPALLAAMYLLAVRWWNDDPVLAEYAAPSVHALLLVATKALGLAMQRPKLSSLQAGLLLLQRHHPNAWPLTVQLTALAQELGLHLDCTEWSIPYWERQLRRRLAWAVFMQDKWSSLVYGRPSHLHATNWAVSPLTADDFNEGSDEKTDDGNDMEEDGMTDDQINTALFLQMVELTSIMSEVVDTFYTQAGMRDIAQAGARSTQLILSRAKPVQLRLKEWFVRLPPELKMDSAEICTSPLVGHLHLAYFATEICIHRRIVQSLAHATTSSAAGSDYALYMCRTAAKTRLISAMDFVNRLRPEHLDAFWYFPSANNFALIATFGNLLRATAPGYEEATFYDLRLKEYRWALGVSAKRAEWIGYAIRMLDVTSEIVADLPEKPRSGDASPASRT